MLNFSGNKDFVFNIQNFGILNFIHGFHESSWVLVLKSMFKRTVPPIFNCIFYQMPYSIIQDLVYVRISWQMKRKLYALTQKWSQTSFSPFLLPCFLIFGLITMQMSQQNITLIGNLLQSNFWSQNNSLNIQIWSCKLGSVLSFSSSIT